MMPNGKPNILVMWGDDKRRELDATGAVDLLDRAQLDPRPSRHRQVLHTQRMHLHPPIERLPVAPRQGPKSRTDARRRSGHGPRPTWSSTTTTARPSTPASRTTHVAFVDRQPGWRIWIAGGAGARRVRRRLRTRRERACRLVKAAGRSAEEMRNAHVVQIQHGTFHREMTRAAPHRPKRTAP